MNFKELLRNEVDNLQEFILEEVCFFLQFLKQKYYHNKLEVSCESESFLQKDWLRPEEDEAWQDL